MSAFTEDDLKRLKEIVSDWRDAYNWQDSAMFIEVRRQQLGRFLNYNDALIARLEAAEKFIECRGRGEGEKDTALEAWRKAAGK